MARLNADSLHLCSGQKTDSQNLRAPIGLTNWMGVTSGFLPEINWRNVLQPVYLSSAAKKHLDNASLQEEKGSFFISFPERRMYTVRQITIKNWLVNIREKKVT